MQYNQVLTTDELIAEMKNFKWTRKPKELQIHHTWKPTVSSFNKLKEKKGDAAYTITNDGMKNSHIKAGQPTIGQHLTLCPDGMWIVGRDWNSVPYSIAGRNSIGFSIEMVGNFDIEGLKTSSVNTLGYDIFHGTPSETELAKFSKFFLEFFVLTVKNGITFHRDYSYKTCPGNNIDKAKFLARVTSTVPVIKKPAVPTFINIDGNIRGERVKEIQSMLVKFGWKLVIDGAYGPKTTEAVTSFQKSYKLTATGIVDVTTYELMREEFKLIQQTFKAINPGDVSNQVRVLQRMLNAIETNRDALLGLDGNYGPKSQAAVKKFQTKIKVTPTGVVDRNTWDKLIDMSK